MDNKIYDAAIQGDADAQYELGTMYNSEKGVLKNNAEAIKWYRKAAAQNHAESLNSLAWKYSHGDGVKKDCKEAVNLYWKAAKLGNSWAYDHLAQLYEDGMGVPKDENIAADLRREGNRLFRQRSAYFKSKSHVPSVDSKESKLTYTAEVVAITLIAVTVLSQCTG